MSERITFLLAHSRGQLKRKKSKKSKKRSREKRALEELAAQAQSGGAAATARWIIRDVDIRQSRSRSVSMTRAR